MQRPTAVSTMIDTVCVERKMWSEHFELSAKVAGG